MNPPRRSLTLIAGIKPRPATFKVDAFTAKPRRQCSALTNLCARLVEELGYRIGQPAGNVVFGANTLLRKQRAKLLHSSSQMSVQSVVAYLQKEKGVVFGWYVS